MLSLSTCICTDRIRWRRTCSSFPAQKSRRTIRCSSPGSVATRHIGSSIQPLSLRGPRHPDYPQTFIHEYICIQPSEFVMHHRIGSQYILLCKGTYVILPSKLTFHRRRGSITVKVNLSKVKPSSLFPNALSIEFGYIGVDRCPIPGICRSRTNDVCDGIVCMYGSYSC